MTYFNTNRLDRQDLVEAERQTNRQEGIVLAFFRRHAGRLFTPEQVHDAAFGSDTPITSVRRAITTLTNRGILIKTDQMRASRYGKPAHCWTYEPPKPMQLEFL